jgi:hypothetical protein
MYGGPFPYPSGSSLNSYPLGDVVAYDSKAEAESEAEEIRKTGVYTLVTVEPVLRDQHAPSIAEERHAIVLAKAVATARADALEEAAKVCAAEFSMPSSWAFAATQCAERIRALIVKAGKAKT